MECKNFHLTSHMMNHCSANLHFYSLVFFADWSKVLKNLAQITLIKTHNEPNSFAVEKQLRLYCNMSWELSFVLSHFSKRLSFSQGPSFVFILEMRQLTPTLFAHNFASLSYRKILMLSSFKRKDIFRKLGWDHNINWARIICENLPSGPVMFHKKVTLAKKDFQTIAVD